MTKDEFERALRGLVGAGAPRLENTSCVECHACQACVECTFCRGSRGLLRSHYCVDCERCVSAVHCRASKDLFSVSHASFSERCSHSQYLVRSFDCTGSSYLFGCVGLVGKDFHVLNEPHSRSDYFALTSQLKKSLGLA